MYYVKLTDKNLKTYKGFTWNLGKLEVTSGKGELCGDGWLHCYGAKKLNQAELLAVLLNPIHADFTNPRMFRVDVGGNSKSDKGLKFGFTEITLTKELKVPEVTLVNKVAFGILCALEVCKEPEFIKWAEGWLSGEDRTEAVAWAAEAEARAARAAEAAARAAWAAAEAAAWAAAEAEARAAEAEARAAEAAARAAWAAAEAAAWAAESECKTLNLGFLAEKSLRIV